MSPAKKKADYYRAKVSFGVEYEGAQITIPAGEIIPGNSKLIKQVGLEHFEEVTSFGQWDVETATAAPGEKRGASAS
jgi:hypothetical protein